MPQLEQQINDFGKERGKWKVGSGKWKVESGKWEVESGKWRVESRVRRSGL